jgi:hypothetical protein
MPIQIYVVDTHTPLSHVLFFYTKTRLASQSGRRISLMNPAAISFAISFLIAAFLSGEKR